MRVSKGDLPVGRLNEGSPEGGEIRNLPPLAGSLPTFLPEQESMLPEAQQLSFMFHFQYVSEENYMHQLT